MLQLGSFVEFGSLQTIRAWHIVGRLGGCNAMNMQVSCFSLLPWEPNFLSLSFFLSIYSEFLKHNCIAYRTGIISAAVTV